MFPVAKCAVNAQRGLSDELGRREILAGSVGRRKHDNDVVGKASTCVVLLDEAFHVEIKFEKIADRSVVFVVGEPAEGLPQGVRSDRTPESAVNPVLNRRPCHRQTD